MSKYLYNDIETCFKSCKDSDKTMLSYYTFVDLSKLLIILFSFFVKFYFFLKKKMRRENIKRLN